ncbi:MAG: DUF349 domain-containing protein [Flaviflexus sp.]|nr:DUF349 domain-containing protein [Flaviflexus sp.]
MTMPHEESGLTDPQGRPEQLDPTAVSGEQIPPAESGVDVPVSPDPQALATEERKEAAEELAEQRIDTDAPTEGSDAPAPSDGEESAENSAQRDEPASTAAASGHDQAAPPAPEGADKDQAEAADIEAKEKEAAEDPMKEPAQATAPEAPARESITAATGDQPADAPSDQSAAEDTPAAEQATPDAPAQEAPAEQPSAENAEEKAAPENPAPETPTEEPAAEDTPAKEATAVPNTPEAPTATTVSEPEAPQTTPESKAGADKPAAAATSSDQEASPAQSAEKPAADSSHEATKPGPKPAAKPRPGRPKPRPRPKRPAAAVRKAAPTPPVDPRAAAEAASWGRVDDEGNVYLRSSGDEGERLVGQYAAGGSKDDALGMFVRRYLDLVAHVALLESRIENVNPQEITAGLKTLEQSLVEPAVVGDVKSLQERTERLKARLKERHVEFAEERRRLKAEALERRTKIIDKVEEIAGQDPDKTHWRDSRARLNQLFEQWKSEQREGPKIDRKKEEELWQRFSRARTTFDRHRRQFFSRREAERAEVIARKEALIKRAQSMNSSTDWGATSAAYRDLLEEWKAAGHASRKEDNELWSRFRAAQQVFFDARQEHHDSQASEQNANLKAKLELVKEAQALLPVRDIKAAKTKLHDIQDRWENIGFVPRKDIGRTEGKLREVEEAIRRAEEDQWRKSDPTKAQRASGLAAQLEESIAKLEKELADAKASGDPKAEKEAEEALEARKAWMKALDKG